jgi:ribosomal protein S27AE
MSRWPGEDEEKSDPMFTCPKCGMTSHNSHDVWNAYCGNCHLFIRDRANELMLTMQQGDLARLAAMLEYVYLRALPDGSRYLAVERLFHGQAYLKLVSNTDPHSIEGADDVWMYETLEAAIVAAGVWDPAESSEPSGWWRHPFSGRRRPSGNARLEYVRP